MAAQQMKKVADHLTCPVCYDLYRQPKYLPCYHSYCEECLVKLVVQSGITCPECRKTSDIPSGGVKQLPNNFFINRLLDEVALRGKVEGEEEAKCDQCTRNDRVKVLCLDCGEFLCNHCLEHHKYSKEYQNHSMVPLNELRYKKEDITIKPKSKFALCKEHELELNFYCETCDQLVCHYCIVNDRHLKHVYDSVKKMAIKHRKELENIVEPVEKMIDELSIAHTKVSSIKDTMGAQADDIDKEIDRYYDELHQRLQQQRDELKKELHEASKHKRKEVMLELEQMQHIQAQLESVKELNCSIKNGSDQEVLLMKKQVVDTVKRIGDSYKILDTQPVKSMEFIPVERYKKSMPQFGHLYHGNAYPLNCEVNLPQYTFNGKKIEFKVITRDERNYLCCKRESEVFIQAQSDRGDVTLVDVYGNKDGSYSSSFVANQIGEVKFLVTVNGQQIKGSPFNVKVHRKYATIDKPGKVVSGRMGTPWGITFSRNGTWAVADVTNNCVWIFDSEDCLIGKFGSKGIGNGKFSSPYGLTFHGNNQLYVTDHGNHRIQKFDISGRYMFQFGSQGSSNGQLCCPLDVLLCNGKLYVTEHTNSRISVFQLDGQFSHIIGKGCLHNPYYLSINTNNQLLVADNGHHCISIFTLDGDYVGKYCTRGSGRGQLSSPIGITTDIHGFIFVTEQTTNRVSIFDKDGIFIHSFGSKDTGHGQFSWPTGIAINPIGDIYVSDKNNKKLQIFS